MAQIRKVGLLNLNDSFSFLQLKEKIDSFSKKLNKDDFDKNLTHLASSRPFTMNKYLIETKELIRLIEDALTNYGKQDQYVFKMLNEDLSLMRSIKIKLEKPF